MGEENASYLRPFVKSFLTDKKFFVFQERTKAAGITLNDEKFGMLYGQ